MKRSFYSNSFVFFPSLFLSLSLSFSLRLLSSTTWNSLGSGNPRKDGNRSQYFEGSSDSFDDDEDDDAEQAISVSSRGRHRRISSKVRRYFCE